MNQPPFQRCQSWKWSAASWKSKSECFSLSCHNFKVQTTFILFLGGPSLTDLVLAALAATGTSVPSGCFNSSMCLSISDRAFVSLADLFRLSLLSGVSIGLMKASSIVDLSYGAPKNRTSYLAFLLSVVFLMTYNERC
jgi:hypothetical protein